LTAYKDKDGFRIRLCVYVWRTWFWVYLRWRIRERNEYQVKTFYKVNFPILKDCFVPQSLVNALVFCINYQHLGPRVQSVDNRVNQVICFGMVNHT